MLPVLQQLSDEWFLREPALFALYCQQQWREEVRMECPVRCGQGYLEYNPLLLARRNFHEVEQLVRIELIRLFLKHPYERQPEGCGHEAMSAGSDITIADGYCLLHHEKLPLRTPDHYHLPLGQYYEWYVKQLQEQGDASPSASSAQNSASPSQSQNNPSQPDTPDTPASDRDKSQLWREDSLWRQRIDDLIRRTTDWGTLPAEVVERIVASTGSRLDNSLIWRGFRSAILSSRRALTRMRPNRRTGFMHMGSTRQFDTRLLVAVDVSGSISDHDLERCYGTVNRMLRYGIAQIDACQFDAALGPVTPLAHANRTVSVTGRGGTSFQPVIDYIDAHREYDALVIFTDGEAPSPIFPPHFAAHILWVCTDRNAYQRHATWMRHSGRCCFMT